MSACPPAGGMSGMSVMSGEVMVDRERMDNGDSPDDSKQEEGGMEAAELSQTKPPPRKRRRIVISCTECHRRKQKCDRQLPCTNCTSRGKEASCRYETGAPQGKDPPRKSPPAGLENIPIKAADFGYSQTGASTLGFLQKIDGAGGGQALASVAAEAQEGDHFGSRERYKSLIRHLPAKLFVEKLVAIYFREFNWLYYCLDEDIFQEQLASWYSLPYNLLSAAGPQGIEPALRSFPALVFQVMATALLAIPSEADETFSSLKYAGSMTFEDIALEYSETGMALLSLLGKRQMTVSTVLAGWVRASFLKYTGQVTEAWHQVGTAVRDAQEIGLHRDQFDPQPGPDDSTDKALEAVWDAQQRRRIWMTLVGWDLHTGAVLGRPTSVDYRTLKRSLPIDAPAPKNRRRTPVFPRGDDDPPTPLTRALWAFETMRPLREILDLEKEGPFPKDFTKVEALHEELLRLQARVPAPFRLDNPDTRFDDRPECWWIPLVRPTLPQVMSFNFMALHRPYIFTRSSSRHEALKASLDMLEAQRLHFAVLSPHQYKTFSLFFGTFDAIVMMASIYILFPKEHPEMLRSSLRHFRWGVERFETMAARNRLAHAALGVLNAIYIRLKKAIGHGFLDGNCPASFTCDGEAFGSDMYPKRPLSSSSDAGPASAPTVSSADRYPSIASASEPSAFPSSESGINTVASSGSGLTPAPAAADAMFGTSSDWPFPTDFDFSTLPPMYPMGDVAYNDLTGFRDDGATGALAGHGHTSTTGLWPGVTGVAATGAELGAIGGNTGMDGEAPWQFGGDFGNDTIWNLLNQIPPC